LGLHSAAMSYPVSPKDEIEGLVYFSRLCDKVRLFADGKLGDDYQANLGVGMDLWTCEFLQVEYKDLAAVVNEGASDAEALYWAFEHGKNPSEQEKNWWNSYMRNRGFRDDLSERLEMRITESGFEDLEIKTFFDYIDADEGRVDPNW